MFSQQAASLAGVMAEDDPALYPGHRRRSSERCLNCELITMGSAVTYDNTCSQCGRVQRNIR